MKSIRYCSSFINNVTIIFDQFQASFSSHIMRYKDETNSLVVTDIECIEHEHRFRATTSNDTKIEQKVLW